MNKILQHHSPTSATPQRPEAKRGGALGTIANKGATVLRDKKGLERRRLEQLRKAGSQMLISEVMKDRKHLKHHEGDFFLNTETGEIQEAKFIRPPRVASCSWALGKSVTIDKNYEHNRAYFSGIQTCSSIWACPSCAAAIRRRRAQEITHAVESHQKQGGHLAFLTLTLSHHKEDKLNLTLDTILDGWKNLTRNRTYRELKKELGITGYIRAAEVTYSEKNGWHPHAHVLLFLDENNPLTPENKRVIEDKIFKSWERWCLKKTGKKPSREHGIDLQAVDEKGKVLSRYISKVQTKDITEKPWSVSAEIARADVKKPRANSSIMPFHLLDAEATTLSKKKRADLWREYVSASKNRRAITWSRGLKDAYGINDISDEQALEEEKAGSVTRYFAPAKGYNRAVRKGHTSEVLEAAENEAWEVVSKKIGGIVLPVPVEPQKNQQALPIEVARECHEGAGHYEHKGQAVLPRYEKKQPAPQGELGTKPRDTKAATDKPAAHPAGFPVIRGAYAGESAVGQSPKCTAL